MFVATEIRVIFCLQNFLIVEEAHVWGSGLGGPGIITRMMLRNRIKAAGLCPRHHRDFSRISVWSGPMHVRLTSVPDPMGGVSLAHRVEQYAPLNPTTAVCGGHHCARTNPVDPRS